ncbi:MAG: DegT/DnrJ/EryC1/StrS family aminotransferase [Fibrobacterota bacterium]|nr:MAG: DegT/DnrJ/EryC1/StrS family aminotransferase [Fibrobacterota bacterium]
MNQAFLPFALPDLGQEEIDEVVDSMKSGWITTGPKAARFEKEFASYVGAKFSFAVNSATSGLHLALDAIGLERGDKVITTPYTFTATSEVIRYFDADPIYSDIDPRTLNLDMDKLEETVKRAVTEHGGKVKAIMPVHMAGQACPMAKIMDLARRFGLKVVEDAAHALPTTSEGRMVGSIGDITVFSFYATKTLATAEGGMVVTDDETFAKRIKVMRLHGFNRDAWDRYNSPKAAWYYEIVAPGYKYNMPDICAAMGIHQLAKCESFSKQRNEMAGFYFRELAGLDGVELPHVEIPSDRHAWHLFIVQMREQWRDIFFEKMQAMGIGCSVHFIPLHLHPYWRDRYGFTPDSFPLATSAFRRALSLPLYTRMSQGDLRRVVDAFKEVHAEMLGS